MQEYIMLMSDYRCVRQLLPDVAICFFFRSILSLHSLFPLLLFLIPFFSSHSLFYSFSVIAFPLILSYSFSLLFMLFFALSLIHYLPFFPASFSLLFILFSLILSVIHSLSLYFFSFSLILFHFISSRYILYSFSSNVSFQSLFHSFSFF